MPNLSTLLIGTIGTKNNKGIVNPWFTVIALPYNIAAIPKYSQSSFPDFPFFCPVSFSFSAEEIIFSAQRGCGSGRKMFYPKKEEHKIAWQKLLIILIRNNLLIGNSTWLFVAQSPRFPVRWVEVYRWGRVGARVSLVKGKVSKRIASF